MSGAHKTYVLVDEQNRDILALAGEAVECSFNGRGLCLCVYNEEVLLAVRRLSYMLRYSSDSHLRRVSQWVITYAYACKQHARASVLRLVSALDPPDGETARCIPHRLLRRGTACLCTVPRVLPY